MENEKSDDGIHIGNVGGNVIGVGVKGSGNIIGENISIGSVSLSDQQLRKIPQEYADSLKAFTDAINQQFKANNVPADKVQEYNKMLMNFQKSLKASSQVNS